jgi:large subunit ribosomal protein L9
MKVIDLKTKKVQEVSLGYAVNYLLPKKLAVIATSIKLEELKKAEKSRKETKKQISQDDRQKAEQIDGKVVLIKVQAGKSGKVHGSVSKKDIAKELKILKTNIELEKPIKKIGEHEIKLKFGKDKASIKLKIEAK